jgi:hypothetical protein
MLRKKMRVAEGRLLRRRDGRPGHRSEDNIKMDLGEMSGDVNWIYLLSNRDQWQAVVCQ